jgi:hypothetical protein
LESHKTPSELDHATPDAGASGARKPALAPAFSALVRRAGETGVAGDRFVIAPAAREDLIDKHVRRLDTHPENPRNQANHNVRAFLYSRSRSELAQAFLLDRADLVAHYV